MKRLLIATLNSGKVREFAEALLPTGIEAYGLDSLSDMTPIAETGETFEQNARLKALEYRMGFNTRPSGNCPNMSVSASPISRVSLSRGSAAMGKSRTVGLWSCFEARWVNSNRRLTPLSDVDESVSGQMIVSAA